MNTPTETPSFDELGLRAELLDTLSALGYEEPTPIQVEAIPPLHEGRDLLGQAATGTGKTAAFALPVLQRFSTGERGSGPAALVLVPTRELAMQVSQAFHRYGRDLGVRVLPIYGGQPIVRQLQSLSRGVDVVVATPGRAIDHLNRGTLRLDEARTVVLDEADEMLDMGFAEDIEEILEQTPADRQTVLFSATMPARVERIARSHLRDPVRIEMGHKAPAGETPRVRQSAYVVARAHKPTVLGRILDVEAPSAAIVFCRTREEVDQLTESLNGRGYRAEAIHGGMSQEQRDRVMGRLRSASADLLVATDVAARGLDIEQLTHVVNYNVPSAPEAYVHRIGRVGRAGRAGVAITLAEPREHRMLKAIERVTKQRFSMEKVPTVADLHARRLELTRASLEDVLQTSEDLDRFRVVLETLTDEFDVMDVALAAVKLAHETGGNVVDEEDIPQVAEPARGKRPDRHSGQRGGDRQEGKRGRGPAGPTTRVFFGIGRQSGVRPQDLVGAIAGESRLSGREIGAIEIADRFSLVEVPEAAADDVIKALRQSTIKGKKATVRRERYEGRR
ncbi:DEAD/DEAH box helicase [Phytoactinopolyspora alkaliphila]|uniref:DEAD/DEAH box helicase n=1 Tax=Phytoactinopolyspora alkaliphila TaxID=1783498 RepID=UPI001C203072